MVFHAASEKVKKLLKCQNNDARMKEALAAYRKEQAEPEGPKPKGLRKIAEKFQVAWRSLANLANGQRTQTELALSRQKVAPAEEKVLVTFVKESADLGFPLGHRGIEAFANAILHARIGPDYVPVGSTWIYGFLGHHRDELQMHWSRPLDTQRARALNPEAVTHWFSLVDKWIVQNGIQPEDIYGMDESGFPPALQGRQRVAGSRGTKTQHKQGGADRQNVTGLVTICADGTTVEPMVIFKGKHLTKKWGNNNIANAT